MMMSSVTIGIPTYNRSALLREAIESVLAQSHQEFRLLICDNASEDDTADLVTSLGDPRIDYRRWPTNIGMVGNVNRVIELTETPYLASSFPTTMFCIRTTYAQPSRSSRTIPTWGSYTLHFIDPSSSCTRETARSLIALSRPVELEHRGRSISSAQCDPAGRSAGQRRCSDARQSASPAASKPTKSRSWISLSSCEWP